MKIIIKNNNHNCRQNIKDAVCSVQTKRRLKYDVNEKLSMKQHTEKNTKQVQTFTDLPWKIPSDNAGTDP